MAGAGVVGLVGVWALTILSRLPPGVLTLLAIRTVREAGVRRAAAFLAGALMAEMLVAAALVGGVAQLPARLLQHRQWRCAALSAALLAGAVLLWPRRGGRAERPSLPAAPGVVTGFALALTTPGVWTWWASVGAAVLAGMGSPANSLLLGVALVVGLATSHFLLLTGLGAVLPHLRPLPPPARRWLAGVLLGAAAAALVAGLR